MSGDEKRHSLCVGIKYCTDIQILTVRCILSNITSIFFLSSRLLSIFVINIQCKLISDLHVFYCQEMVQYTRHWEIRTTNVLLALYYVHIDLIILAINCVLILLCVPSTWLYGRWFIKKHFLFFQVQSVDIAAFNKVWLSVQSDLQVCCIFV